MNKNHVIDIATSVFGKLDTVVDDVYKGILKVNEKDAGIYYIDITGSYKENFDQYQENLLAKEYYNNSGSLQWNYYLLLLQDQVSNDYKTAIEKNDKYARKYIFN